MTRRIKSNDVRQYEYIHLYIALPGRPKCQHRLYCGYVSTNTKHHEGYYRWDMIATG